MDFYPDTIPRGNVSKAEKVLSRWQSQLPGSGQWRLNLAWFAFLIGDYPTAMSLYRECAEKLEQGELPATPAGILIYQNLGRCYDLPGDQEKALAYYAKVEKLVTGTPELLTRQPDPLVGLGLVGNPSRTGASGAVQGDRPTGIVNGRRASPGTGCSLGTAQSCA